MSDSKIRLSNEERGGSYIDSLVRELLKVIDYSSLTNKIDNKYVKNLINQKTVPHLLFGAYKGAKQYKNRIKDRNRITITISSKRNELYEPTLGYLASNTDYLKKKDDKIEVSYDAIASEGGGSGRSITFNLRQMETPSSQNNDDEDRRINALLGEMEQSFIPLEYSNTVKYKGIEFEVTKSDNSIDSKGKKTSLQEDILEFTIEKKNRKILKEFFREVIQTYYESNLKKGLRVFSANSWGGWEIITDSLNKDLEGVFIDQEDKDYITKDIDNFLSKKEKLKEKGIPYKRNFLFHGVSGTGKTTLIKALATKYRRDIYFFSMNRSMDNNDFIQTINDIQSGSFIVIEEVDVIFNQREKTEGNVSFDVFINALDGIVSKEDSIIFMTTNHIEKVDEALMRPGRVDTQLEFKEGEFSHFKAMAEFIYDKTLNSKETKSLAKILGLHNTYKHSLIQNFYIKFNSFEEMIQSGKSFEKFKDHYN